MGVDFIDLKWMKKVEDFWSRWLCINILEESDLFLVIGDKGSIATTPTILPPPYVLKLGQFCFEVPPEDDVKANFRTPPMEFHGRRGAAAKDI
jgi:hypothetical protein